MSMNIISMTRGDSYSIGISIKDRTLLSTEYIPYPDDVVYFGLMRPKQSFEEAILKRKFEVNEDAYVVISLKPEDTVDLAPGLYYYAVKLRQFPNTENEQVITIINKTKFVIND